MPGSFFVMLDRGDYLQCAYVIPKGDAERVRRAGCRRFRAEGRQGARRSSPARVDELQSWDDVKL